MTDNPIKFTDPDGMDETLTLADPETNGVTYDNFGNATYHGEAAQNYARGIQAYTNKVVSVALGFAGVGNKKGGTESSAGGPPHDGDRNSKGEMYSEFVHGYVPPKMFYELKRVEERLNLQKMADENAEKTFSYAKYIFEADKQGGG